MMSMSLSCSSREFLLRSEVSASFSSIDADWSLSQGLKKKMKKKMEFSTKGVGGVQNGSIFH